MNLEGTTAPYAALPRATPCEVIGFEPVTAEFEKLRRIAKENERYLPHFVGDGSKQTFHECNFPMTSSLYEPHTELLAKFTNLEELVRVVKTYPVQTIRLDDLPEVRGTDLLKMDDQEQSCWSFAVAPTCSARSWSCRPRLNSLRSTRSSRCLRMSMRSCASGIQFHKMLGWIGRTFRPLTINNNPNGTIG